MGNRAKMVTINTERVRSYCDAHGGAETVSAEMGYGPRTMGNCFWRGTMSKPMLNNLSRHSGLPEDYFKAQPPEPEDPKPQDAPAPKLDDEKIANLVDAVIGACVAISCAANAVQSYYEAEKRRRAEQ